MHCRPYRSPYPIPDASLNRRRRKHGENLALINMHFAKGCKLCCRRTHFIIALKFVMPGKCEYTPQVVCRSYIVETGHSRSVSRNARHHRIGNKTESALQILIVQTYSPKAMRPTWLSLHHIAPAPTTQVHKVSRFTAIGFNCTFRYIIEIHITSAARMRFCRCGCGGCCCCYCCSRGDGGGRRPRVPKLNGRNPNVICIGGKLKTNNTHLRPPHSPCAHVAIAAPARISLCKEPSGARVRIAMHSIN